VPNLEPNVGIGKRARRIAQDMIEAWQLAWQASCVRTEGEGKTGLDSPSRKTCTGEMRRVSKGVCGTRQKTKLKGKGKKADKRRFVSMFVTLTQASHPEKEVVL